MKLFSILSLALSMAFSLPAAAQAVPDAGLHAETQGQWARAVDIYAESLRANPAQAHLWERIADIQATRLNAPEQALAALREAAKHAPNDARLHHKLSQSLAARQDAPAALAAIERAVALDPDNLAYLRARAELAAWNQDLPAAQDSYRRILAQSIDDPQASLGLARVQHWQGNLAESSDAYQAYLARHPDEASAWREYIVVITELGDYARASDMLDAARARLGDSDALRKQEARILALAERATQALGIVSALAPGHPGDYDLGYTRTVALHHANRPREALSSLADVALLKLGSEEVADLTRFVHTPLRSNARIDYGYAAGSDDISLHHAGVRGEYVVSPETRLFGGGGWQRISTETGSSYVTPAGSTSLNDIRAWIGIRHRTSPRLSVDAEVGHGSAGGDSRFIYEVGADIEPADALSLRVSRRQDLHMVSPRAAALGIERRANTLDATWSPGLRHTIASRFVYDTFSDGNDRWEAVLAPRRAVLRTQRLNLDIGVSGRWFGYDRDPGNGYYAPSRYERYALTAFSYWKIDDDNGVSLSMSAGPYKDNRMGGYRTGGDIVAEGFFGIYRDWYLNVKAAYSDYGGGDIGAYRSSLFEISLTRRF